MSIGNRDCMWLTTGGQPELPTSPPPYRWKMGQVAQMSRHSRQARADYRVPELRFIWHSTQVSIPPSFSLPGLWVL